MAGLVPLEYRKALDGAMALLAGKAALHIHCRAPELRSEVGYRFPGRLEDDEAEAGLWVEPQVDDWWLDLASFSHSLSSGAPLAVVMTRPLGAFIPERDCWGGRPVGLVPGAMGGFIRALKQHRFRVEKVYGFHTLAAFGMNCLSRGMAIVGRPDLEDRLNAAARLVYCLPGRLSFFSTVALLAVRKQVLHGRNR